MRPDPELTGQIYECSHLGGHRFAPTALLLPNGYMYGRLDLAKTQEVLDAAWNGGVAASYLRGRTSFPQWAQVAEIAVRQQEEITSAEALDVVVVRQSRPLAAAITKQLVDADSIEVRHRDGRAWSVELEESDVSPRPTSCGADPKPTTSLTAKHVASLPAWRH